MRPIWTASASATTGGIHPQEGEENRRKGKHGKRGEGRPGPGRVSSSAPAPHIVATGHPNTRRRATVGSSYIGRRRNGHSFRDQRSGVASAVKGTLESARHTVSAASDVDSLAGAWPHGTPMDLVIIDDLSAHDLLDETRRSLSRLMDGKAGDGTGTAVRPRTLLLSTPPRTPKANPDDTPQVRRQTPCRRSAKQAGPRPTGQAAPPIVSGRRFQRPAHSRG